MASMPMVTSHPSSARAAAWRTAPVKAASSAMVWSAAKEPTTAPGPWRWAITAAARPIAAMESRGEGSARIDSAGTTGSWAATASTWAVPVTIVVVAATGSRRATVPCRRVRPAPVRSRRNFGRSRRLSGQSLVPAPPAGMIAWMGLPWGARAAGIWAAGVAGESVIGPG